MNHTLQITQNPPPTDMNFYQAPYLAYCTGCGHNIQEHAYNIETWWQKHIQNIQQQEQHCTCNINDPNMAIAVGAYREHQKDCPTNTRS